jgi:hypothetical protein
MVGVFAKTFSSLKFMGWKWSRDGIMQNKSFLFAAGRFSSELNSVDSQIWNHSKQINTK